MPGILTPPKCHLLNRHDHSCCWSNAHSEGHVRCWISSLSCRPGHEWQSSGVHGVREGWEGDWGEVVGGAGGTGAAAPHAPPLRAGLVLRGRGGGTALERGGRQPPGRRRAAGSRGNLLSPTTRRLALNGRRRLVKGLGPVRRRRDAAADDQHGVGQAAEEPCSPQHWVAAAGPRGLRSGARSGLRSGAR